MSQSSSICLSLSGLVTRLNVNQIKVVLIVISVDSVSNVECTVAALGDNLLCKDLTFNCKKLKLILY